MVLLSISPTRELLGSDRPPIPSQRGYAFAPISPFPPYAVASLTAAPPAVAPPYTVAPPAAPPYAVAPLNAGAPPFAPRYPCPPAAGQPRPQKKQVMRTLVAFVFSA